MRDIDSIPGDPRFKDAIWEILLLHAKKQADYGTDGDPFANIRSSEEFGVPAWIGTSIRLNDKVKRLKSMAINGQLENESIEDSFDDISVYALIGKIMWRGRDRTDGD